MKFPEAPEDVKLQLVNFIREGSDKLTEQNKEAVDHATRFLFWTNSGGAVAVLSFMGASENVREMPGPQIALAFFALGIVLTGVLLAFRVHRFQWMLKEWLGKADRFIKGEIPWNEFLSGAKERAWGRGIRPQFIIAYAAFACFILGVAAGAIQFFFGGDPPSQAKVESFSGLAQNLGLTNLVTGTYMAGDITEFLGKWQTLVGSILGGVFALAVAFIVAMSARRREERASGMVVTTIVAEVIIAHETLSDLAEKENIPEKHYPLWLSEKLMHMHPLLHEPFQGSVAYIMPIDSALAAHLALFRTIYSHIQINLERLSEDYQYFRIHKKHLRPEENIKAGARLITKGLRRAAEHAKCSELLISKLILSKVAIWHRLKRYVYQNKQEKECLNLLKKGSS